MRSQLALLFLMFCVVPIFPLHAELPADGGAEGHGGGGDLEATIKKGRRRLELVLGEPSRLPDYVWKNIKPETVTILAKLSPAMMIDLNALQIVWLTDEQDAKLAKEETRCIVDPLSNPKRLFASPTRCRKLAARAETAAAMIAQALLIRQKLSPNEIADHLPGILRLCDRASPFVGHSQDRRESWSDTEETLANLELSLKVDGQRSTPKGYLEELERARKLAIQAIWDKFPRKKPDSMGNEIWKWLVDYGELLVREVERSPFEVHPATDPRVANQKTCGSTKLLPNAVIYFNHTVCNETVLSDRQLIHTVVHESAHHLAIKDEEACDRIGRAVTQIYENNRYGSRRVTIQP